MSLGSKSVLVNNALTYLFGEGFSFRAHRIPDGVVFPESVKHFDNVGVSYLPKVVEVVHVTNGFAEADVTVKFVLCNHEGCGELHYRVVDLRYTVEYQPTPSGQQAIYGTSVFSS